METAYSTITRRRLFAVLLLISLAAVAGSAWGYWLGYDQGKQDIIKQIE